MAFDAFISYSNKDKIAADAACAVLERAGVRCWIAPRDIRPGGEYGAAIIEAIDHCRVMVLIFSSSANTSQQILREIERAVSKGVAIVPVRIEDVTATKSMAYFLSAIHWLDALTPPIESHLQQLAETVKAILQVDQAGSSSLNDKLPPPSAGKEIDRPAPRPDMTLAFGAPVAPPSKTSGRTKWLVGGLSAALCLALLAGGAWLFVRWQAGSAPPPFAAEALVPEAIPFIPDSDRALIRSTYLPAPDHKAIAVSNRVRFVTGQKDEETAKKAALDSCKRVSGDAAKYCELYAVGNVVVYQGARPLMPAEPWVVRDPSTERPLVAKEIPLLPASYLNHIGQNYPSLRGGKAIAIAAGHYSYYNNQSNTDEAVRRSLEWCSLLAGTFCLTVVVEDVFVVTVPTTMKVVGLFRAADHAAIAADARADVARRLANATSGWNVVAVGASGRAGLALRAAKEQEGIDRALADCNRQDRDCRVISIGPFLVEPLPPKAPG